MKKNSFFARVYEVVREIPEGTVMTYGQVAQKLGTHDARRVGHALHANKNGSVVPCHRVVNREGGLASGYVFGGPDEQKDRLIAEGVKFVDRFRVDLKTCGCPD